jgi:hypothetical protein
VKLTEIDIEHGGVPFAFDVTVEIWRVLLPKGEMLRRDGADDNRIVTVYVYCVARALAEICDAFQVNQEEAAKIFRDYMREYELRRAEIDTLFRNLPCVTPHIDDPDDEDEDPPTNFHPPSGDR